MANKKGKPAGLHNVIEHGDKFCCPRNRTHRVVKENYRRMIVIRCIICHSYKQFSGRDTYEG